MTCIVGMVEGGKIIMGADSAGIGGYYDLTVRADEKIFINQGMLIGFSTSFRMGQVLRYSFSPRTHQHLEGDDLFRFMVTDFVDAARAALKTAGFPRKDNEQEVGGHFLVGIRGRLFKIESDYQVAEAVCGYAAVGCGDSLAIGCLYGTAGQHLPGKERIEMALACAEEFSAGVRRPFKILETSP